VSNLETALNKPLIRWSVALLIVFPFTLLSGIAGIYGLMLGAMGFVYIVQGGPTAFLMAYLGIVTVIGWAGVLGGFRRVMTPTDQMTEKDRLLTRKLLWCGVFASLSLAAIVLLHTENPRGYEVIGGFMLAIACVGGVLLRATPKIGTGVTTPNDTTPDRNVL